MVHNDRSERISTTTGTSSILCPYFGGHSQYEVRCGEYTPGCKISLKYLKHEELEKQ